MMQRPNSSSSSSSSPIRFPIPFTGNRVGAPPISPYSQIPATLPPKHSRSLSQPSSLEETNGGGFSASLPPSPFTMYHSGMVTLPGGSLPPRKSHRRSNSDDVTFGFGSMMPSGGGEVSDWSNVVKEEPIFCGGTSECESMDDMLRGYVNLDNIHVLNSLSKTVEEMQISGSEGESNAMGLKRRAGGDIAHTSSTHCRSVSMDSCFFGKLLPPSPTNPGEGNSRAPSVRFGNCEFNADEMKRISGDVKLAQIAMVDPKRAKRILANRVSAARSKERKAQYKAELEHKVQTLQTETTTLSTQITYLRRGSMGLRNQNTELRFRLQAMEQQAQLRNALSEKLIEEVQRLRLVIGEPTRSESNISNTSISPEMFQQQLRISQLQQHYSNQNSTMRANHASDE